jgi:D-glycero-alpha-D-manno-heptose-7-phosphate kinase
VESSAPCRADLAGGTLDIWPLGILHDGALTVNVALSVGVTIQVARGAAAGEVWYGVADEPWRSLTAADGHHDLTAGIGFAFVPGGGLEVRVLAEPPRGSGLGGSSSYAIALARALLALEGVDLAPTGLVALVRDLEARVLRAPAGTQDHWAAWMGGAIAVHLEPGGDRVETLAVDPEWLASRLTVFFTGLTHHSGMVNWEVIRRRLDGDADVTTAFEAIAAAARSCRDALIDHDEKAVASAVRQDWLARRGLAPEVCPPELDLLAESATTAGALAVKACGAGGGGSLLAWHRPDRRDEIVAALEAAAPRGRVLATGVSQQGSSVRALGR